MRLAAVLVAGLLALPFGASADSHSSKDPVSRAVKALGGADALKQVKSITVKGQVRHWEPEQSMTPGGEARLAGDSTFTLSQDFGNAAARIDWVRDLVYPAKRQYKFTETLAGGIGYVQGIDSTARTKPNLESNPPAHAMSGLRVAATQRELLRASPLLLLDMQKNPKKVKRLPAQAAGDAKLPAVRYQAGPDIAFTVLFDPATGLPARIRSAEYDNMHGDSTYDLILSDWQAAGGVQIARGLQYQLNGMDIARAKYDEVAVNPPLAADAFASPEAIRASAPKAAKGEIPWQWVLRRQNVGVYLDSDKVSFDPAASGGLKLVELAPGVQHVVGGTHNSLIVALEDFIVVFDAPINEWQSNWTIEAAKAKYPGKPIRYLVLSHHHMDHAGGFRSYVAEGARIVVGMGAQPHYHKVAGAPHSEAEGLPPTLPKARVIEVTDNLILTDGKRDVGLYLVENPHSEAMLIGYVKDARIGFVTDIWSPGRDKLGDKLTGGQAALVAGVKKHGLNPERFAGGHGTTGSYAELEALGAKSN